VEKITTRKIPDDIEMLHPHPLLHRIYAARGILQSSELKYDLKYLLPYNSLKGIESGVEILITALLEQKSILIIGDFDTDGATSTALAILALKVLGFNKVSYLIPNRFKHGYGLTPEIAMIATKKKPYLIITVDNGISSIEGIHILNKMGIKVIITDHHLPGKDLPEADTIINPNQKDDRFISKNLAGVGVIFYLMLALRTRLRELNWFMQQNLSEPNMAQFLDLVALGTIADSVNLDYNNRILITNGIKRIKAGNGRLGINALFAISGRNYTRATNYDFSFVIIPRLNAAGRIDDMSIGVECLLTNDLEQAYRISHKLDNLNNERRNIGDDMYHQASKLIDNILLEKDLPSGVCVFEKSWHQGILGILAGRLKDKLNRPVIVFTAINDHEIKGSARSINHINILEILHNIANNNPKLITKFGGHAMAAGLNLTRENYSNFSEIFSKEVNKYLISKDINDIIYIDGEVPTEYFNLATAELLHDAGPWGIGFTEPIFFGEFSLIRQQLIGTKHLKLVLRHLTTNQEIIAIHFNVGTKIRCRSFIKLIYSLNINEYNNNKTMQLIISKIIND
jgi:single-stranded-DNA-specific exonuclease